MNAVGVLRGKSGVCIGCFRLSAELRERDDPKCIALFREGTAAMDACITTSELERVFWFAVR